MKRTLRARLAVALALTLSLAAAADGARGDDKKKKKDAGPPADLSGAWTLDLKKSGYEEAESGRGPRKAVRLLMVHREPEIRVTRVTEAGGEELRLEQTFYADGRGEKNPAVSPTVDRLRLSGAVESLTRWKDGRLVIFGTKLLRTMGDLNRIEFRETWEVSADGKTLTQTTRHDNLTPPRLGAYSHVTPADANHVYTREQ